MYFQKVFMQREMLQRNNKFYSIKLILTNHRQIISVVLRNERNQNYKRNNRN